MLFLLNTSAALAAESTESKIKIEKADNLSISKVTIIGMEASGSIDWNKNTIRATAIGYASRNLPPDADIARIHGQAKTAAEVTAQRNLVGIIQGMLIQSHTEVELGELMTDSIKREISGMLKGAVTVASNPYGKSGYEVTVEVNFDQLMKLEEYQQSRDFFARKN